MISEIRERAKLVAPEAREVLVRELFKNPWAVAEAVWRGMHPEKEEGHARQIEKHGISKAQYEDLLEEQSGVCAICGQRETARIKGTVRRLAVDHDHKTGRIRGLLCGRCNLALPAHLGPEDHRRIADYLEHADPLGPRRE